MGHATGWYLLNRLITGVAMLVAASINAPAFGLRYIIEIGDGGLYLQIAEAGYFPADGTEPTFLVGLFPLLPGLIRGADVIVPGGATVAALVVCFVAGWAATVAVTFLGRELYGARVARRVAALLACFPGAFVFSLIYTEGLLLAAAATALLLLHRRRWVWAGVAGAVATAARPTGVTVVAAAGVVALTAIARRRDWMALFAPVLSSSGILAYFAYLWNQTGRPFVWFETQTELWDQDNNAGGYVLERVTNLLQGDWDGLNELLVGIIILVLIPILVMYVRHRPPDLAVNIYVAATLVITLSSVLGPRPRFLLASFPLIFPFAQRWTGTRHEVLVATGLALVAILTLYYTAGIPAAELRHDADAVLTI